MGLFIQKYMPFYTKESASVVLSYIHVDMYAIVTINEIKLIYKF